MNGDNEIENEEDELIEKPKRAVGNRSDTNSQLIVLKFSVLTECNWINRYDADPNILLVSKWNIIQNIIISMDFSDEWWWDRKHFTIKNWMDTFSIYEEIIEQSFNQQIPK